MKFFKYLLMFLLAVVLYVVTAIPLGMWVYSWKSEKDINLFQTTGVHSYISCLRQEAYKAKIEKKNILKEQKLKD